MNISKELIDDLNAVVTIKVGPEDYENKVTDALKRVQRQAAMPGFRPGKVPSGLIKKQYGRSILVDELNKILNDTIHNYINENKIDILGNPLPKTDTAVDWDNQKEFTFNYDLGLAPQFEVEISDQISFDYHVVKVDDALIDKYIKDVKRNYGQPSNPEVAGENDVLFVDINELGDDGNIVAGGIFKSTSIGLDRIKNETVKAKLLGAKKEDKIVVNCKELYETPIDLGIGLGVDKEVAETLNCDLQLTVKNIARLQDAELNQELFDRIYGEGKVNSEEEFRNKIKEELAMMFVQDQDRRLQSDIEKTLVEKYNPQLPEGFLKRWLIAVNEKPITMEQVEAEFDNYAAAMKWKLIENKIIKKYELSVSAEEAREEAKRYVRGQYSRYGQVADEKDVENIANSILSKEQEAQKIFEGIYSQKVLGLFKTKAKLNTIEVGYNEFFGIKE
ncbi:MAG: trigger factor [Bacteroidia bacterium]